MIPLEANRFLVYAAFVGNAGIVNLLVGLTPTETSPSAWVFLPPVLAAVASVATCTPGPSARHAQRILLTVFAMAGLKGVTEPLANVIGPLPAA